MASQTQYMLIDTTQKDHIRLSMISAQDVQKQSIEMPHRELLTAVDQFILSLSLAPQDISGIGVAVGRGSFTSTRLAVTLANTFAYVLKIPVIASTTDLATDYDMLAAQFASVPVGQYITATYSSEPHIGS